MTISEASITGFLDAPVCLDWANDLERRRRAGVPEHLVFATKPEIALEQLGGAVESGVAPGVVLADAGYGDETAFRDGMTELGLL